MKMVVMVVAVRIMRVGSEVGMVVHTYGSDDVSRG